MTNKCSKKITEWTLPICANTDVPTRTHIQTKTGCLAFLFSPFPLSLSCVYLSLWKGCASVSLLSLARSLLTSSLTFTEHSTERSDLPALCAQRLFVCVFIALALWLGLLFCINKWIKSVTLFLEKNNRWNCLIWCQCVWTGKCSCFNRVLFFSETSFCIINKIIYLINKTVQDIKTF